MKKSFLTLIAASLLTLAACNGNANSKDASKGGETPSVPTEAGKVTFYFEMGTDAAAIEIPSYCSIYLTGAFFGEDTWPTAADEVVTLKQLEEGSNIYYGQWEGSLANVEDRGYQLTLGYAADSGAPSTGVNWSYKSIECQAGSGESGMDNLSFEVSSDGLTANLGTHHWEEAPGEVKIVENVTVQVTLKNAVPEYVTLYAPGNFRNNWSCSATEDAMTPSADRKVWTIKVDSVNLGTYEMKVIAEYTGADWGWGNVIVDNGEGGNFSLNILRANANGTIDLNERANEGEPFDFDFETKMPDPTKISTANFTIELAEALDTTVNPQWFIIGSFTGWKQSDALTVSADKKTLSLTIKNMVIGAKAEFGVCVNGDWNIAVKAQSGENYNNFSYEVPAVEHNVKVTVDAAGVALMNTAVDTAAWVNVPGVITVTNK